MTETLTYGSRPLQPCEARSIAAVNELLTADHGEPRGLVPDDDRLIWACPKMN